jgi:hypothetical protein
MEHVDGAQIAVAVCKACKEPYDVASGHACGGLGFAGKGAPDGSEEAARARLQGRDVA